MPNHRRVISIIFLSFFFLSAPVVFAQAPEKKIALTFDDGPYGEPTTEVLDILKKENVHATFFLIGKNVEKYPEIVRAIIENGNVIGNHTYDHPKNLVSFSDLDFKNELSKTESVIFSAARIQPVFFRAPYGRTSAAMQKEIKQEGYTLVCWNIDPIDWNYSKSPAELIVKRVLEQAKPNSIILMHDGRDQHIGYPRDNLVKALPVIIDSLRKEGYDFVTVDEIFHKKAYK